MDLLREVSEVLAQKPGLLGRLAARIVGESDRLLTKWIMEQLEIRPDDLLLELGCGFGSAINIISGNYRNIFIVGADNSPLAVTHAWERNKKIIRQRQAMLLQADFEKELPLFSAPFTKVYAINTAQRLRNPVATLSLIRAAMAPSGKIVLAAQPREKGATDADTRQLGKTFRHLLTEAGFTAIKMQENALSPVAAVSVSGINQSPLPTVQPPDNPSKHRKKKH